MFQVNSATAPPVLPSWTTTAGTSTNVGQYSNNSSGLRVSHKDPVTMVEAPGNATARTVAPATATILCYVHRSA